MPWQEYYNSIFVDYLAVVEQFFRQFRRFLVAVVILERWLSWKDKTERMDLSSRQRSGRSTMYAQ